MWKGSSKTQMREDCKLNRLMCRSDRFEGGSLDVAQDMPQSKYGRLYWACYLQSQSVGASNLKPEPQLIHMAAHLQTGQGSEWVVLCNCILGGFILCSYLSLLGLEEPNWHALDNVLTLLFRHIELSYLDQDFILALNITTWAWLKLHGVIIPLLTHSGLECLQV